MRIRFWRFISLLLFSFLFLEGNAQDPQFSQFYANSLYLNPGFTGNTTQMRFATTYRNQWPSIPGGFNSYTAGFDYNIEEASIGTGFLATYDQAGSGGLSFTEFSGLFATHLQFSRLIGFRPGIKVSYAQRSVNQSKLVFADQIARGGAASTLEQLQEGVSYVDFGVGAVLAHKEKYWAGFAVDHLTQPSYGLIDSEASLPLKLSIHGGWNFEVNSSGGRRHRPSNLRLIAHYKSQGKWDQLDIGGYYEDYPMVFGMWYRGIPGFKSYKAGYSNNDAIVLLVGVKTKDWRIGYSYDITISKLMSNTGGSHEISIVYEYANKRKKRRRRRFMVPCAKF